jgi:hypothetical protein
LDTATRRTLGELIAEQVVLFREGMRPSQSLRRALMACRGLRVSAELCAALAPNFGGAFVCVSPTEYMARHYALAVGAAVPRAYHRFALADVVARALAAGKLDPRAGRLRCCACDRVPAVGEVAGALVIGHSAFGSLVCAASAPCAEAAARFLHLRFEAAAAAAAGADTNAGAAAPAASSTARL